MLGITSCKVKSGEHYGNLYKAKWESVDDKTKYGVFTFKIINDDYLTEVDFNNLGGIEGVMLITTKSRLPFETEDRVWIQGTKYHIKKIDSSRKEEPLSEGAYSMFKNNGNLNTVLVLRRAGK